MSRGTVVCGVTETPDGRGAAKLAGALGRRLGLRLVLAHVIDGVPPGTHESLTARQRQAGAERVPFDVLLAPRSCEQELEGIPEPRRPSHLWLLSQLVRCRPGRTGFVRPGPFLWRSGCSLPGFPEV